MHRCVNRSAQFCGILRTRPALRSRRACCSWDRRSNSSNTFTSHPLVRTHTCARARGLSVFDARGSTVRRAFAARDRPGAGRGQTAPRRRATPRSRQRPQGLTHGRGVHPPRPRGRSHLGAPRSVGGVQGLEDGQLILRDASSQQAGLCAAGGEPMSLRMVCTAHFTERMVQVHCEHCTHGGGVLQPETWRPARASRQTPCGSDAEAVASLVAWQHRSRHLAYADRG